MSDSITSSDSVSSSTSLDFTDIDIPKDPKRGRVGLRKRHHLLYRELHGDDGGVGYQFPKEFDHGKWLKEKRKQFADVKLDAVEFKKYIILGERPTYPYHIISIRRPHAASAAWLPASSYEPSDSIRESGLVYWNMKRVAKSASYIILKEANTPTAPAGPVVDLSDQPLAQAYTVWDIVRDHCVQILFWPGGRGSGNLNGVRGNGMVELRYGEASLLVDVPRKRTFVGTCFLGVNVMEGYPRELYAPGVVIPVVFNSCVLFFEPFGWREGREVTEQTESWWSLAPETRGSEKHTIGGHEFIPRVSVLDLREYVLQFLKNRFTGQYANRRPQLDKLCANIVDRKGVVRVLPNNRDYQTTVLAVGAVEHITETYTFFILSINAHTRTIKPLHAKMLTSSSIDSTYSPESLVSVGDVFLFREAMVRAFGGEKLGGRRGWVGHDCAVDCVGIEGSGGVKVLCGYMWLKKTVGEVWLDEGGVVLKGWR